MAAPAAVLSILVKANTGPATTGLLRLNAQLGEVDSRSQNAAKAVSRVARNVALIGAAGTLAGIGYAVKKAADFEQQMSSLGAVTDATGREMERFRRQALKAGADTKFSALEAAQAQTELAKGGLRVRQIMRGGLRSALALAAAGEMELADAAEATVNAMKLFGLRGRDAMKVADAFATAANKTTADVSDFAMALKMGGSAAKASGLNFIQTTAILEALAEVGIKGSDAGTSMKAALTQLAAPTQKSLDLQEKLGLAFFDAKGNMKGLADISKMLRSKMGDLSREQRLAAVRTLVGTDGMRTLLALYDAGPRKMGKFQRELGKEGTAAEVAKKKQDNLKGSLEQLQGSIETLAIQIGSGLLPHIRTGLGHLERYVDDVSRIFARDDLDLGEKLQRSFDLAKVRLRPWLDKLETAIDQANIPDKLGAAVSAATPVIAKALAASALVGAKTFAGAFASSDVWGKLVLGGWLLARMGGKPAFFKMGATAGTAFGAGMASTGGGIGGFGGKVRGVFKGAAKMAGRFAALDLAINLVDQKGNPIAAAINTAHDLTFGIVPKVDVKTGQEKADEQVQRMSDMLDRLVKGRDTSGIAKITEKIKELAAESRAFGDDKGAKAFDEMGRRASSALERIRDQQARTSRASDNFAAAIRGLRLKGSQDFGELVKSVVGGSRRIKNVAGENTKQAREEISRQFDIARRRVETAMDKKIVSVKKGTELLRDLARKELKMYGISAGRVDVVLAKGANGEMRPHQRGGPITDGAPSGDSVPAMLEKGEYVLNRTAVRKVGRRALDRLNFAAAPRFQQGGMIDPAWDPGSERLAGSISGRVGAWAKRFQANMTAGYDPGGGHVSPGHNVTGTATDMVPIAGDWDLLEKGLRALVNAGLKVLYGSNGIGTSWPNHGRGNHAHIEWGGAAGGLPLFDGLPRVALRGPMSVALEAGQGALDRVRSAANAAVERAIGFAGEGPERGAGFSGPWTGVMAQIAKARGWSLSDWRRLVMKESGGNPNARNPSSGAYGLGQFLGATAQAYAKYGALSPDGSAQISAMARYISDRYGNPSAALAFHDRNNWYAAGGLVGAINKTLRPVGKSSKLRKGAVGKLLDRIKSVGLPGGLEKNLRTFARDADVFGEYADRAGALGSEDANGNPISGLVAGKSQAQWLEQQLEALFKWRNALVRAEEIVVKRREVIAKAIENVRFRLFRDRHNLRALEKRPKRNRAAIRVLRPQVAALERIIGDNTTGLIGRQAALGKLRGDLLSSLEDVQGVGSPTGMLKTLPALGVLGGRIFDTQMQLRDLMAPKPAITDPETGATSERESLLSELLRQANLRTAVSEAQFKVFKDMPQFGGGGVVPGVRGQAVPAVVHAGEGVFTPDQMAAIGGSPIVVIVQDGAVREDRIKVLAGKEAERAMRTASVKGQRGLPSRGGGLLG